MSEFVKISGLWDGYKEGVYFLRGIDKIVNEGEAVGIISRIGSGKSTLGKVIMNMILFVKTLEIVFETGMYGPFEQLLEIIPRFQSLSGVSASAGG